MSWQEQWKERRAAEQAECDAFIPDVAHRKCWKCQDELPLDDLHFEKADTKSGWSQHCKQCIAAARRKRERQELEARVSDLDESALKLLSSMAGVESDTYVPHLATVFENLMRMYGGVEGFSRHFMVNYLMAKPGSQIRHKSLELMVRLATKVTESGAAKVPLELLTDEDLEREIESRTKRIVLYQEEAS